MDSNYQEDLRKFKRRWKSVHGGYQYETNTYEYVNIGNNIELEYFTLNLFMGGEEGVNASLILRNQNQITESVLADMLKNFRDFFISETDKIQLSSGTMGFFKLICEESESLMYKISSVMFDPGFQSNPTSRRDTGLKLSSMEIWYDNFFDENSRIYKFLEEKMLFKTMIFNPQEYYDRVMLTKPQVDLFNEKLFLLSNNLNQQKKFEIILKQFLKGGNIKMGIELPLGDGEVQDVPVEVSWHYEIDKGDPPYLRMTVDHSHLYNNNNKGSLWGHIHENGKGGHYVIRLTEQSYQKLKNLENVPWEEIEKSVITTFQQYVTKLLDKYHMSFDVNEEQFKVVDH